MNKPQSKKTVIYTAVIIVVMILAYLYFSGSPVDNSASLEAETQATESSIAAANVLSLLNQISSLRIDTAIFTSPVYRSLVDHTVPVLEQNVGRTNPFAPR
ncbi:MAG: hypothetical protein Q8Q03_02990 [bacterium]|nr:hypothetical protein [bacterium]